MNLRTTFPIDPSENKISFDTPVMFIGSCFASEMGGKMEEGRMKVHINPAGVVYNPVSVGNTIDIIVEKRVFNSRDLYKHKGLTLSFSHYTDFSSEDPDLVLERINNSTRTAHEFLKHARFLFITFGTARVYRFKETNKIVSNCHKIPSSEFSREILSINEITELWDAILNRLHSFNSNLKVIFTISPVRHWKDGAHGNQISKSVLILAVENLLKYKDQCTYFPAYELFMDDLRDYRFYAEDMLHPSEAAIGYIWNAFSECYFDPGTMNLWREVEGITRARNHRFITDSKSGKKEFAANILKRISQIEKQNSQIDLQNEKSYFSKLIGDQ